MSKRKHTNRKSGRTTVLIIIRHAATPLNENGVVQGARSDTRLSARGRRQAKLLADRLLNYRIDSVYSSDMTRCRQTIAPYLKKTDAHVHYVHGLRERDYGIFDGKAEGAYSKWKKEKNFDGNFDIAPPGGESFKSDVMKRVKKEARRILKREAGRTVLICAHNSVNKALMMVLFSQQPEQHYGDYTFANAGMTMVKISAGKPKQVITASSSL